MIACSATQTYRIEGQTRHGRILLAGLAAICMVGCGDSGATSPTDEAKLREKLAGPPTMPGHKAPGGNMASMKRKGTGRASDSPSNTTGE